MKPLLTPIQALVSLPLKQGLKLKKKFLYGVDDRSFSLTSIKTRIETLLVLILKTKGFGFSLTSIKTRIET